MANPVQALIDDLRKLARCPGFSIVALLALIAGIGPTILIFSLIDSAFLKPLSIEDPERVVAILGLDGQNPGYVPHSYPNFVDLHEGNTVLSGMAASRILGMSMPTGDDFEFIFGRFVTEEYFDLLGVSTVLGRGFGPEDFAGEGADVVVISHRLWRRRFDSDAGLIGRSLVLDNHEFTVIGVAAPGFNDTNRITISEYWLPMSIFTRISRLAPFFNGREWRMFDLVGRLAPGGGMAQAEARLKSVNAGLREEYPEANAMADLTLVPIHQIGLGPDNWTRYRRGAVSLMLAVGVLLLMACANVAGLFLAREAARPAAGAGASHGARLVAQGLLLALLGAAGGWLFALATRDVLWQCRPFFIPPQSNVSFGLDGRVAAFTLVVAVVAGLLATVPAAIRLRRTTTAGHAGASGRRGLGLRLLVIAQIGLALVALVGAGLFQKNRHDYLRIDPGFGVEDLIVMSLNVGAQGYDQQRARQYYLEAVERTTAVPGVEAAALGANRPLNFAGAYREVRPADEESEIPPEGVTARLDAVSLEYFETLGIPVTEGRGFTAADDRESPAVGIVNETMAARLWPRQSAVGERFQIVGAPNEIEVVGVARDCKYNEIDEAPRLYFYLPIEQFYVPRMALYARVSGDPQAMIENVRKALQPLDEKLHLMERDPVWHLYLSSLWRPRLSAVMASGFGILALVLASIGVYVTVAMAAARREGEAGSRLKPPLIVVGLGLALGLGGAIAASRALQPALYEVSAADPRIFAGGVLALLVATLLASRLPTRWITSAAGGEA